MSDVKVVQPVYFAVISREILGDTYEAVCASIGLNPIDKGFGLMLAVREDLTRCTLIANDPALVRDIAAASPNDRDFMILGEGRFPIMGNDWVTVPAPCIIGTAGRLVIIGPANYGLGAQRPVHSLTYLNNGADAGAGRLGYARGDELDAWRADLAADGWVVDDRAAMLATDPERLT